MFDVHRFRGVYALLGALLLACLAAPAGAAEKFRLLDDKPLDDSRRPAPGKALIYFMRPQVMGAAVKVKLFADGTFLSIIGHRGYVPYECDPGKHEFITTAENAGFLEAEVAADKTYYVQVAMHMGAMKARTHFEVARPGSDAMKEITEGHLKARLVETTDEGRKWVEKDSEDIQETIADYRKEGDEVETLKPEDGFDAPPWKK